MLSRGQVISQIHLTRVAPKIHLVSTRTPSPYQLTQLLKNNTFQRHNHFIRMGAYVQSDNFTSNPRRYSSRRISLCDCCHFAQCVFTAVVDIQPTSIIFLYDQQLTTTSTSLPPSELTQLQALYGTEHPAFVPPIDLNHPDAVSLTRARPGTLSTATVAL